MNGESPLASESEYLPAADSATNKAAAQAKNLFVTLGRSRNGLKVFDALTKLGEETEQGAIDESCKKAHHLAANMPGLRNLVFPLGRAIKREQVKWIGFNQGLLQEMERGLVFDQSKGETRAVDKTAANGLWRFCQYEERQEAKQRLKNKGKLALEAAGSAVFLAIALSLFFAPQKTFDLAQALLHEPTATSAPVLPTATRRPTRTVVPTPKATRTPEPTATLDPETQRGEDWAKIIKQYKNDGHDFLGAQVIGAEPVNDFTDFRTAVLNFLEQHNQLTNEGLISYNPGEGSEISLWIEVDGQTTRVRFEGPNVTPPWEPHTFYYNPSDGVCSATADQPLDNGAWKNSEIKFAPAKPQACIAVSDTWSARRIVVAFLPIDGQVTVRAAIFRAK